jgi:hypothetical protein
VRGYRLRANAHLKIPAGERFGLQMRVAGDGKRFVTHAVEKLTAFLEWESVIQLSLNHLFQLHPSTPRSRQHQSWCRLPSDKLCEVGLRKGHAHKQV